MPNTEEMVLEIFLDYGGEASVGKITRASRLSSDYIRMICESLARRGYINYLASKRWCILRSRGVDIAKRAAAKKKGLKKTMFRRSFSGFSRDREGKLFLDY